MAENRPTDADHAARIERFRTALMESHADRWSMEDIAEAAHVCARAVRAADQPPGAGDNSKANAEARDLVVAIMTARFAGDTQLAMNLVQAAPDQGMLAWQFAGMADPLIQLAAADAGVTVPVWWRYFATHWAVVNQ